MADSKCGWQASPGDCWLGTPQHRECPCLHSQCLSSHGRRCGALNSFYLSLSGAVRSKRDWRRVSSVNSSWPWQNRTLSSPLLSPQWVHLPFGHWVISPSSFSSRTSFRIVPDKHMISWCKKKRTTRAHTHTHTFVTYCDQMGLKDSKIKNKQKLLMDKMWVDSIFLQVGRIW